MPDLAYRQKQVTRTQTTFCIFAISGVNRHSYSLEAPKDTSDIDTSMCVGSATDFVRVHINTELDLMKDAA